MENKTLHEKISQIINTAFNPYNKGASEARETKEYILFTQFDNAIGFELEESGLSEEDQKQTIIDLVYLAYNLLTT